MISGKQLYWLAPTIFVVIIAGILFTQSVEEVTEVPEDNWSRALAIGKSSIGNYPFIRTNANGNVEVTMYDENSITNQMYDKNLKKLDTYHFPNMEVTKWFDSYTNGNDLIYYDYKHVIDGESGDIIAAANQFYPLTNSILYLQDHTIFEMDPTTRKSTVLIKLEEEVERFIATDTGNGPMILTYYSSDEEHLELDVYHITHSGIEKLVDQTFVVPYGSTISNVSLASDQERFAFLFNTTVIRAKGKQPVVTTHFFHSDRQALEEISFYDPITNSPLSSVDDIKLGFFEKQARAIFVAKGASNTRFKNETVFNIYEAFFSKTNIEVHRRSNTPSFSIKPQWIDENTIIWLDRKGTNSNDILVSSNDSSIIKQANSRSKDDYTHALGKTMGSITTSFFGLLLSIPWALGPMITLLLFYKKWMDHDPEWIYYIGLGSYLLSFVLFKDWFFIDMIYTKAPNYLTFTGSGYVYFTSIGILAFILSRISSRKNDWSVPVTLFYFVFIHIVMMSALFGPYLL